MNGSISYEPANYISVSDLSENSFNAISTKSFFKISKKLELDKWDEAPRFLE